jgi:hypothetical protein
MRVLVVYESMFGNTMAIAEAVAQGLAAVRDVEVLDVDLVEVGSAPDALGDDVDVLLVGGPTHAFGLTRARTRADAAERTCEPLVSTGPGLREWLAALPRSHRSVAVAVFDTRARKPGLPGSAAKGAAKRLRRLGLRLVVPPESFTVEGMTGPLTDGEAERARSWAEHVARVVAADGARPRTTA